MRVKNKDIAAALGISTAAVSLALNNKPGVSDETRARVLAYLKKESAVSLPAAADPAQISNIMFVIHKHSGEIIIDKPFFSDLLESIQTEATVRSCSLTVHHFFPNMNLREFVNMLNEQKSSGAILLATEMTEADLLEYKRLKIPFVLVDSSFDYETVDAVTLDNQTALMKAVKYAYSMGHRKIGYLQSSVFINNFGHRYDGYVNALRHFGLELDPRFVIPLPPTADGAYQEMKKFLATMTEGMRRDMPTCFVSDLDYIAIGAINGMKELGIRIPDQVSVIGFDDVLASELCDPPLTTIRVNRNDIGRIAANILLEQLNKTVTYCTVTRISSQMILRSSVIKKHL